jgi:ABC-type nitrate/sulfonate/bicarbonate transport system substrate-binding protein
MRPKRERRAVRRFVPAVAVLSTVTAVLAGCSSSGSSTSAAAPGATASSSGALQGTTPYAQQKPITPLTTISIAYSAQSADVLYLFAAMQDGVLAREGLQVKAQLIQSAPVFSSLISGQVQFVLSGSGDMLSAVAGGAANLRWIGTANTYASYLFYTRPGITKASQLNGATIASTSTAGMSTVCSKLAMAHLGITDYKMAYLGSVTSDAAALQSGAAQGICINPPSLYALNKVGDHSLWDLTTSKVRLAQEGVATTETEIQSDPNVVQRLMTALTEGEKLVHETTPAAVAADLKLLDQITGGSIPASETLPTMQYEWTVQSGNLTPEVADFSIGQKYEAEVDPAIAKINLSTVVDPTFASAAATAVYGANPPS